MGHALPAEFRIAAADPARWRIAAANGRGALQAAPLRGRAPLSRARASSVASRPPSVELSLAKLHRVEASLLVEDAGPQDANDVSPGLPVSGRSVLVAARWPAKDPRAPARASARNHEPTDRDPVCGY